MRNRCTLAKYPNTSVYSNLLRDLNIFTLFQFFKSPLSRASLSSVTDVWAKGDHTNQHTYLRVGIDFVQHVNTY